MKFAIFDMDGLLIDSEPVWRRAQRAVLHDGYGIDPSESELLAFQGRSTREFCDSMARRYGERGVESAILLDALLGYMAGSIVEAPLLPGAREILDWLDGEGVALAIASSSPLGFIETVVSRHGLPVPILVSGTEVPRSKPHPAVFELTAERLGASPSQCRVWEDSLSGVIAAKAAAMEVVAVPDPAHPAPEKFAIADRVHRSLQDSLAELQRR